MLANGCFVQDFLFFELGIDRLVVVNAKTNIGSRRVKEKTGARFLGIMEFEHHEGGSESEKWEVTRKTWRKLRGGESKPGLEPWMGAGSSGSAPGNSILEGRAITQSELLAIDEPRLDPISAIQDLI